MTLSNDLRGLERRVFDEYFADLFRQLGEKQMGQTAILYAKAGGTGRVTEVTVPDERYDVILWKSRTFIRDGEDDGKLRYREAQVYAAVTKE